MYYKFDFWMRFKSCCVYLILVFAFKCGYSSSLFYREPPIPLKLHTNGHQVVPYVTPPPLAVSYGRFPTIIYSPEIFNVLHNAISAGSNHVPILIQGPIATSNLQPSVNMQQSKNTKNHISEFENKMIKRIKYRKSFQDSNSEKNRDGSDFRYFYKFTSTVNKNLEHQFSLLNSSKIEETQRKENISDSLIAASGDEMMHFSDELPKPNRNLASTIAGIISTFTTNAVNKETNYDYDDKDTSESQEITTIASPVVTDFEDQDIPSTAQSHISIMNLLQGNRKSQKNYEMLFPVGENTDETPTEITTMTPDVIPPTTLKDDFNISESLVDIPTTQKMDETEQLVLANQPPEVISTEAIHDSNNTVEDRVNLQNYEATETNLLDSEHLVNNGQEISDLQILTTTPESTFSEIDWVGSISKNNETSDPSWLKELAVKALERGNGIQQLFAINIGNLRVHLINAPDFMSFWKRRPTPVVTDEVDSKQSIIPPNRIAASGTAQKPLDAPVESEMKSMTASTSLPKVELPIDPRSFNAVYNS